MIKSRNVLLSRPILNRVNQESILILLMANASLTHSQIFNRSQPIILKLAKNTCSFFSQFDRNGWLSGVRIKVDGLLALWTVQFNWTVFSRPLFDFRYFYFRGLSTYGWNARLNANQPFTWTHSYAVTWL